MGSRHPSPPTPTYKTPLSPAPPGLIGAVSRYIFPEATATGATRGEEKIPDTFAAGQWGRRLFLAARVGFVVFPSDVWCY